MANGTTRNALNQMALRNAAGTEELNEEMKLEKKGNSIPKIPLKNPSEHNHSK